MEFRLFYRGPLKANGGKTHKHDIRCAFHEQLWELWQQVPLSSSRDLQQEDPGPGKVSLVFNVGSSKFVPVVSERISVVAELDLLLLRPEPPGAIVTRGGDIDNRLKTLLDALRMPKSPQEIPQRGHPSPDPFLCLLEDDLLVTKLSVTTDRLLIKPKAASDVILICHVRIRPTEVTYDNIGIAG